MDVHNDAMAGAYGSQAQGAEVPALGAIGTRQSDIDQMIRQRQSKARHLILLSAAGPWGAWLSRYLTTKADDCWVVAPSLIPRNPGDRVKTDRRDAVPLARLARSGDLPGVSVPTGEEEALRALARAREDTLSELTSAKVRLTACLLRQEIRYPGRAHWNPAPLRGLSKVGGPRPAQHLVFQAYVRAVPEHPARLPRLAQALHEAGQAGRLPPGGEARQALRGVHCTVAVTMLAAIGALPRCEHPRELMKFLGLLPAEDATGERRRQGSMTKAGKPPARRALVAGAGAYRYPAKVRRPLPLRRDKPPKRSPDSRWKAQRRLCQRSRRLVSRGPPHNVVTGAMARELAGFLGAMAQPVPLPPEGRKQP